MLSPQNNNNNNNNNKSNKRNKLSSKMQLANNNAEKQQSSISRQLRQRYFPESATPRQAYRRHTACTGLEPTHVPPSVRCPPIADPFGRANPPLQPNFDWLVDRQVNNNSGETSSRKVASIEACRREIENWHFMHFRIRMEGYQSLVNAIKQSAQDESIFNEDHLDKWTVKLRFKIRRSSPMKKALLACCTRLGLCDDPDVVFCLDGFYGDSVTGRIGNKNEVPNRIVQPTSSSRAMGLRNGSCLFVSRVTNTDRENAVAQMHLDMQRNDAVDEDESDESLSGGSGQSIGPGAAENYRMAESRRDSSIGIGNDILQAVLGQEDTSVFDQSGEEGDS